MTSNETCIRDIRAKAVKDFWYFVYYLVHGGKIRRNRMCVRKDGPHKMMVDFVQRTEKSEDLVGEDAADVTIACAPRGFFKTSIMVVGYILWCMARDPNIRFLLASESGYVAEERLSAIKQHCQGNDTLTRIFPELKEGKVWQNNRIKIAGFNLVGSKESSVRASGIASKITGQHFDKIILDDVVGPTNTNTPQQCLKVIEYYKQLQSVLQDSGLFHSQLRVIGTIWHFADLHVELLKRAEEGDSDIKGLCMSIYDDWGVPIWPEFYDEKQIEKVRRKINDPQKFANQYLNRVIDDADRLVSPERYQQLCVNMPVESNAWPAYSVVDPSMGTGADKTAIVTWLVDSKTGIPHIVDVFNQRVRPDTALLELLARHKRFQYHSIYFEMHDQAPLWLRILELSEGEYRDMPIRVVKRHETGKTKEVRIRAFGELCVQGWVRFSKTCANLRDLEHQLLFYPKVKNDDVVDACSEIAARTTPPPRQVTVSKNPVMPDEEMRLLRGSRRSIFYPEWAR